MLDHDNIPPVENHEIVTRYLLNKRNIRADKTINPNEFIPYKYVDLSVNRHLSCDETEIWYFGDQVAEKRVLKLLGRTDISVDNCSVDSLSVEACPLPDNPNHADIKGYPPDKADQKALAVKIAAAASDLIPLPS